MESGLPQECEQLLIAGYVLGNLSPVEAALFEEIIAENPDIAKQVEEFQKTLEIAYTPVEMSPPPALRAKILDAASPIKTVKETGLRLNWGKIGAAIATALILALSVTNYRLWQKLQVTQIEIPTEDSLTFSLKGTNQVPENAKVQLVVNPNQLEGILTVENLPPLPPEKVYALWTVVGKEAPFTTDEKGAILTEVFEVDSQGRFTQKIVVPEVYRHEEKIQKVAITIEPRSAPQVHEGSILMVTEVNTQSHSHHLFNPF